GSLIATWIAVNAVTAGVRWVNKRNAMQQAKAWLAQAQREVAPGTAKAPIVRWLKSQGAEIVGDGDVISINTEVQENAAIMGYRTICSESYWAEPLTAELLFHLDSQGRLTEITLHEYHFEMDWVDDGPRIGRPPRAGS